MDVTTSSLPPDVDRRHSYVVLIVTCLVLENVFVLSRLYIRTVVRRALGWDDYLICLALVGRSDANHTSYALKQIVRPSTSLTLHSSRSLCVMAS